MLHLRFELAAVEPPYNGNVACLLEERQRVHAAVGACAVGDANLDVYVAREDSRQPANEIHLEFWHYGGDVLAASTRSLLRALVDVTLHPAHWLKPRQDGFIVVVRPSDRLLLRYEYAISVAGNNDWSKGEWSVHVRSV